MKEDVKKLLMETLQRMDSPYYNRFDARRDIIRLVEAVEKILCGEVGLLKMKDEEAIDTIGYFDERDGCD